MEGKSSAEEMAEVFCYSCGGEQNFPQHVEYLTLPCVHAGCHVHRHLERKRDVLWLFVYKCTQKIAVVCIAYGVVLRP